MGGQRDVVGWSYRRISRSHIRTEPSEKKMVHPTFSTPRIDHRSTPSYPMARSHALSESTVRGTLPLSSKFAGAGHLGEPVRCLTYRRVLCSLTAVRARPERVSCMVAAEEAAA
jgi:hypothetical protein